MSSKIVSLHVGQTSHSMYSVKTSTMTKMLLENAWNLLWSIRRIKRSIWLQKHICTIHLPDLSQHKTVRDPLPTHRIREQRFIVRSKINFSITANYNMCLSTHPKSVIPFLASNSELAVRIRRLLFYIIIGQNLSLFYQRIPIHIVTEDHTD